MSAALSKQSIVYTIILQRIKSGELQAGQKLANDRKLSSELGVSRVTLGKGLNRLVEEGILIRKVGCGTFVNDPLPDVVLGVNVRSRTIGLIASTRNSPVINPILAGLHQVLCPENNDIIIKEPYGDPQVERRMVRDLVQRGIDVLLISSSFPCDDPEGIEFYEEISSLVPVVMIDCVVFGDVNVVQTDNYTAGRIAAKQLYQQSRDGSCFWIMYVDVRHSSLLERQRGFEDFFNMVGNVSVKNVLLPVTCCNQEEMLSGILRDQPVPDGVFLLNDRLIPVLHQACTMSNISFDDLNICCFDNFSAIAPLFGVPYIEQYLEKIGSETASMIIALERGNGGAFRKKVQIVPRLVLPEKAVRTKETL